MKRAVNLITVIALLTVFVGGTMLDSSNIAVPMAIVSPGIIWIGLRALITEVFK